MGDFNNTLNKILNGEIVITDRKKYSVILAVIMLFHMILTIIFWNLGVNEMVVFNIGSVFLYIICLGLIWLKKYLVVYVLVLIEIVLHSFMATLFVGWKFGFALYIVGLIPAGFYVIYKRNNLKKTVIFSAFAGVVELISYICCYYMGSSVEAIYDVGTKAEVNFIFAINSIITFLMLIIFTILFTVKIQIYQNMLIKRNLILDEIANTDPLTGLHNRRSIERIFRDIINIGLPFCIIMCDIDDFKKVNDVYGHEFGDGVLKKVSDTIKAAVRETDYVCRWGGEEILVLVQNSDISEAVEVAQRIHKDINDIEMECGKSKVYCTLTMGIAEYNKGEDINITIDLADKKLYEGKLAGKNVFKF